MGMEMSKDLMTMNFDIPSSLRPVHPFLYEANRGIINLQKPQNTGSITSRKVVIVACINHAVKLLNLMNLELDVAARTSLTNYILVRDRFVKDLNMDKAHQLELLPFVPGKAIPASHDILVAEADETLAFAEELFKEGFRFSSAANYHTACVYYRVMESLLPALVPHIHQRLLYGSLRARLSSNLSSNFVREHFDGQSCADVYEVHGSSKLGKGSYGSVYLATHRLTGDERAVKVMNVDRVTSYYLRKIHTEIEILKSIDHPNIVKVHDVFFGKRSVYIVTDLCRGGELFELLNSGKSQGFVFREDRASKLMRDMISAVHYLHSKGIVHRDLKLENFLFESKTASSSLVLIDFGLSKQFESDEQMSQRVGSCYYTAPEVLNGCYDHRCDIWSLGVLCYMLLSGSPPFHGKDVEDVYNATLTQEAVYPDKKFRHLSNSCMDFLRRLLTKDPNLRITTTQALAHPFIRGESVPRPLVTQGGSATSIGITSFLGMAGAAAPNGVSANEWFSCALANEIVDSVAIFVHADPLTKLMLIMLSHSLPAESVVNLKLEFQAMDSDNDGTISLPEFSAALCTANAVCSGAMDLTAAYNAICIERSHGHGSELTYHEYIAAAMSRRIEIEDARLATIFASLDPDRQGAVTVEGIRKALGGDIPQGVLESMMTVSVVGADGERQHMNSGVVTEPMFLAHWRNSPPSSFIGSNPVFHASR